MSSTLNNRICDYCTSTGHYEKMCTEKQKATSFNDLLTKKYGLVFIGKSFRKIHDKKTEDASEQCPECCDRKKAMSYQCGHEFCRTCTIMILSKGAKVGKLTCPTCEQVIKTVTCDG
jgi:hypothetical protein